VDTLAVRRVTALQLGAALPLVASLGPAPSSDLADRPAPARPNGFATRAAEDLVVLAAHGIGAVRIPVDWARVWPTESGPHPGVLEWYARVLDAAADAGVAPWLSLFEGSSPAWFADLGGWDDERAVGRWWPRYLDTVADALGDRVAGWCPIDRPTRFARRGWLGGGAPPGRDDPRRHAEAVRTLAVAWRDAWRVLRGGAPVATLLELEVVRPADQTIPAAAAARRLDALMWGTWMRALRDGVIEVPGLAGREIADLAGSCDVLGAVITLPDRRDDVAAIAQRLVESVPDRPLQFTLVPPPATDRLAVARRVDTLRDPLGEAAAHGLQVVWWSPGIDPMDQPATARTGFLDEDRHPGPVADTLRAALGA
jgi:hypothetical protein